MTRPAKADLKSLIGRTITKVHQEYFPKEPCRSGEWYVTHITLDDRTEIGFVVIERDAEMVVDLIHRKGVTDG